jgi:hypothetical protein
VLQMASSALKTHLHTSRKIVNDSHTFLLWDFPDLYCDCCLQFTNCLRIVLIHIILEIPPQINIWGVQVWWMRYAAVLMKFWASLGWQTPRMPFGAHYGKNIKILCKLTQMAKTAIVFINVPSAPWTDAINLVEMANVIIAEFRDT